MNIRRKTAATNQQEDVEPMLNFNIADRGESPSYDQRILSRR